MDEVKILTDQLEYLYVNKLIMGLRDGSIDATKARESARKILDIEPFLSYEDAKMKIKDFVATYNDFIGMQKYLEGYYEEMRKNETIQKMREHMKAGNIDQAIQVAKE